MAIDDEPKELKPIDPRGVPEETTSYGIKAPENNQSAKLITVKSNLKNAEDGGYRLALSERHPDHPKGEAFIAGPGEFEVGNTPGVRTAIRDGRLVEVAK